MKLFVGTAAIGSKPDGYTAIDIDPLNVPDILADVSDLSMIESGSAVEFYAQHAPGAHHQRRRAWRVRCEQGLASQPKLTSKMRLSK